MLQKRCASCMLKDALGDLFFTYFERMSAEMFFPHLKTQEKKVAAASEAEVEIASIRFL